MTHGVTGMAVAGAAVLAAALFGVRPAAAQQLLPLARAKRDSARALGEFLAFAAHPTGGASVPPAPPSAV